jgi:sirohydrochlorin cobaltochelatase
LELTEPSLLQVAKELEDQGCKQIHITPLFLGVGKHAREDLPLLIEQLRVAHPSIEISCAPSVGEDPRVIDLLAQVSLSPPLATEN